MNALVGIGANSGGMFSASPEKRLAIRSEIQSLARAALLGKAKAMAAARGQAAQPTAKSAAATKSASTKAADKTSDSDDSDAVNSALKKELDKDTFLQLLVNQMQNQDPMDPVDNSQMIAQLAQFSSLEQMNNLNTTATTMSSNIDQLNFMTANSLLGRKITGLDIDGKSVVGTVSRVQMDGSLVYLTVNDKIVPMSGVMAIDPAPASNAS
jgi:flagellar basal-body rod modification protein FlgD